jgi:hypothetical protein
MTGMKPPQLPDEPPPVLTDDLELDDQVVIVLGKGRRPCAVPSAARPPSPLTAT